MTKISVNDLINFETKVCETFNNGEIKAPIHLYSGNEWEMIDVFSNVRSRDWVFCSWRSHYQCLLKGVDPDRLLEDIKRGKSISLCYPEHRIYSSAIVTGSIPIAVGVALGIQLSSSLDHVWCFVGDMTAETGTFYENLKYATNFDLPITFVIEDNGKSVCTDTHQVWNQSQSSYYGKKLPKVIYYQYHNKYPHAGSGKRIQF